MPAIKHPPLAAAGRERLHDAVGSDAEQARQHRLQVLFENREQAERAVDALQELLPVPWDSISVTPAPHLTATIADDSFGRDATATWRHAAQGAALAAPLGLLLGLFADLGIATGVAAPLLAFGFAGFGAIAGGLVGLARTDALDDDPQVLVATGADAVVVTLRHLRPARHRQLLAGLGGVPVDPLDLPPGTTP
jgi:hypothetical protein